MQLCAELPWVWYRGMQVQSRSLASASRVTYARVALGVYRNQDASRRRRHARWSRARPSPARRCLENTPRCGRVSHTVAALRGCGQSMKVKSGYQLSAFRFSWADGALVRRSLEPKSSAFSEAGLAHANLETNVALELLALRLHRNFCGNSSNCSAQGQLSNLTPAHPALKLMDGFSL